MSLTVSETRKFAESARASSSRGRRIREQITRTTGLTASGIALAGVAVVAWAVAFGVGGRPLYLVSYGIILVLVGSWFWGRRPLPLEGRRSDPRPRVAEGEILNMEVGLTARRKLSTFVLEEQVPPLLGEPARSAIATLDSGDSVSEGYRLLAWRRGAYHVGPLVARWGDPMGLTQREMVLADEFELLVHPSVEPVQDRPLTRLWEDPPIRPPVSKPWPSGMEFYGMREYTPGDDIRRIVWRAYARTHKLLVRESEQGITDKITIIMDQDSRFHSKGLISESFEAACRAAASVGVRHLREGYQMTLEGNARRLAGPLRGAPAQMRFLDALARAKPEREDLTDCIMRLVSDATRDAHMVLLTPRLEADAAGRLKLLLDRGVSVLVAALVWQEEDVETLGQAASLGCQVVEIRPGAPLAVAFQHDVGAGRI